jgi:DNA-binding NarL/FixJ family response regulator
MIQIQALKHHRRPVDCREEHHLQQIDLLRPPQHGRLCADEKKIQTRRSRARHVMLVQKQAIELQAMAEMLSALGYGVTPVEESGKALLYFRREPCEVVISELDMPQFNGFELAQRIRRHSPQTRILLMTACCQAEIVDYMDHRVVDGWLFKPFGIDVLKNKLQSAGNPEQKVG